MKSGGEIAVAVERQPNRAVAGAAPGRFRMNSRPLQNACHGMPKLMHPDVRQTSSLQGACQRTVDLPDSTTLAEGEGFEPPKACTLVVFNRIIPFASVRHSSPTFALYVSAAPFVRQRSP